MKKVLLIILFILFIPNVYAYSYKDVVINNYVNDNANVLNDDVESTINEKSKQLEDADGTQIVVVTIKSLEGNDLESFANDLYNYIGIGDKEHSKGLLILLVTEDRKLRVEVGDGLEGILNDGKVGRFEDTYMISYLSEDNWNDGVMNGYNAFFNEIVEKNNLDLDTTTPVSYTYAREPSTLAVTFMIAMLFGTLIYGAIGSSKYGDSFDIVDVVMIVAPFIIWTIAKVTLGKNPDNEDIIFGSLILIGFALFLYFIGRVSGSSGSSHGGSHWSSSGGGHSSGGFSGGGGHSSGGGASRSF